MSTKALRMLSPLQFQWSVAALAAASLPAMLWLEWHISLCLAVVLGIRTVSARRRPQAWPATLRFLLVIAFVVLVIGTYGGFFGRGPGGALLLSMLALKATESASTRDARLLVGVSLFVLIASFLMTQSVFALVLSGVATVVCFSALEVLSRPAIGGPTGSPLRRLGSKEVLILLSLAIPVTIALWLLFPRLNSPLWGTSEGDNGRSGLSNSMKPNEILELLIDDSPMMRIRFDNDARPDPNSLYFRGPVLWNLYPDGTWTSAEIQRSQFGRPPDPTQQDLTYEVILEPTDQRMLFVADQAVSVSEEQVIFTGEQRFFRSTPVADLLRYRARSTLRDTVQTGRYLKQERQWALNLPAERNPRTVALGRQLAEQFDNPRDIVYAALRMYREQPFRYTLEAPDPLGIHTTDEFTFDTRAGFCQHFSNSFATIMRAAGVPTRVVTGFAGGEYLEAGYFLVSKARAHAWNEVLIDDVWQRVDPTAQVPQERVDPAAREALGQNRSDFMRAWRERRDALADWWNRTVLNFNASKQSALFKPFGIESAGWERLVSTLAAVLAVLGVIGMLIFKWRDRQNAHPVQAQYLRVLQAIAKRHGLTRAPAEGPKDFLNRIDNLQARPNWQPEFARLTDHYISLSYAGELSNASAQDAAEFARLAKITLDRLRQ